MNNDINLLFYSSKCRTCSVFMQLAQKNNILKFFKLICIDGQEKAFQEKGLQKVPTIIIKNNGKPINGSDCLVWLESTLKLKTGQINDKTNEQYLPEVGVNLGMNNPSLGNSVGIGNRVIPNTNQVSNQFEVPKTNILKRTSMGVTPPPPVSNINTRSDNPLNPQNQLNQLNQQMQQLQEMHKKLMSNQGNQGGSSTPGVTIPSNGPSVKPTHQLFGFMENEMSGTSDSYAYLLVDNPLPKSFLPPDKDLQIYTAPEGNKLDKKTQEIYLKNMELFRENEKTDIKRRIEDDHRNILSNK